MLHWRQSLLQSPTRVTALGFLVLILLGSLLLMLPQVSTGESLSPVDALLNSTSAVCVTGLTVVDTGTAFTTWGHWLLLLLIQTGGLGIMTLSTILILLARGRSSFNSRLIIRDTLSGTGTRTPGRILRDVVFFTAAFEGMGLLLLFLVWLPHHSPGKALELACFHSVSAFCNAGFSLFSDSFSGYATNWLLNLVVAVLVIAGGLGFVVLSELKYRLVGREHRCWSRYSLHTRLVVAVTVLLLVVSTLLILLMEWDNTLAAYSWPNRLLASFFQAVNARTSGFNSLPVNGLANETLFVLIIFMFVGASPGSCGGGIKTTTMATLVLEGWARLRGKERPQLFNRSISRRSVNRAVTVLLLSVLVVSLGLMLLLITESGPLPHPDTRGKFLELLFEAVSAFGTVGLSTGGTGELSVAGKLTVTVLMFVGRLGPLVVGLAVSRTPGARYYLAEENIMIG